MTRFQQGDRTGALAAFERAAEIDPLDAETWNNLGVLYLDAGELTRALESWDRALAIRSDYADALNNRALARQKSGNRTGALEDFDRADAHAQGRFHGIVLHNRGVLRVEMGDHEGAFHDFDLALRVRPGHVPTFLHRARLHKERENLTQALADCTSALALLPRAASAPALTQRGGIHALRGAFAAAIADYDLALEIDPSFFPAYIGRGHARYHIGNPQSILDYHKALEMDLSRAVAALATHFLHLAHTRPEQSIAYTRSLLQRNARDWLSHARLGMILVALGRDDEASTYLATYRENVASATLDLILRKIREVRENGSSSADHQDDW